MFNVLILCIDSLRFDAFTRLIRSSRSAIGRAVAQSGASNRAAVFDHAYTTAPWTYPATNSLLTGLYPSRHGACHAGLVRQGVDDPWPQVLDCRKPTLFSLARGAGLGTIGISTIYWALNERCRYDGCDLIVRSAEQNVFYTCTPADWVVDTFLNAYDTTLSGRRFAGYLHFMDLHRPLNLPRALAHSDSPFDVIPGLDEWDSRPYRGSPADAERFKQGKVKVYEGLLRYIDSQIGRLFEGLQARGIHDDTVIVICSDHGEEFWDHEEFERRQYWCGKKSTNDWLMGTGHGHTLFEELVHVPLVVLNPPVSISPAATRRTASLVDVLPTLTSWLGLDDSSGFDGLPLDRRNDSRAAGPRDASRHEERAARPLFMEATLYGHERKAMIAGREKYICAPGDRSCVSFDLAHDPFESSPQPRRPDDEVMAGLRGRFQSC